jgi:putative MATE family efflux protein
MKLIVRDRSFYKTYLSLTAAISLQLILSYAVNLADNVILGKYSEVALSGASIVNQLQFLLQMLVAGVSSGAVILGAQYWGKKDVDSIRSVITLGTKLAALLGVIFTLLTALFPYEVLSLLTDEEAVLAEGMKYLRIMCWTYLVYSISNSLVMSLRSAEITVIGPIISLSTLCINVCLDLILIFGKFGAPQMGIAGAAIATLASRIVELLIVSVFVFCVDKRLKLRPKAFLRFKTGLFSRYIRVSLPVTGGSGMWGVAQAVQTSILGHISATAIAANSIAVIVFQIISVFAMSSASSSSVMTGMIIGEKKFDLIRPYARTFQLIFLINGLISCALMLLLKKLIVNFYSITPEAKELALKYITILAFTGIGSAYEFPIEGGIIQGGGNTRYALIVDNLFMWLFTIPFAAMSAFWWKLSPVATFVFLKLDQILKCLPNTIKLNRFNWIKVLTE